MNIRKPDTSEIQDYQRWEKLAALKTGITRYLDYAPAKPVFSIRNDDIPELADAVSHEVDDDGEITLVFKAEESDEQESRLNIFWDFTEKELVTCLELIDGRRSVDDIARLSGDRMDPETARMLLQRLVGSVVRLPATINQLERNLSFYQIVRFPIRPRYSLLREYWENQYTVRLALTGLPGALDSAASFKSFLSGLHIAATVGAEGRNYYGGGGGMPTTPGEYRKVPVNTRVPEVMVSFIKSEISGMGHGHDLDGDKTIRDIHGRIVGNLLNSALQHNHEYDGDTGMDEDIEGLRESLLEVAAQSGNPDTLTRKLSYFHWLFSHIHPFANINNSIAMNIVNFHLEQEGLGMVPHLFLDYIAQRTSHELYEDIFPGYVEKFRLDTATRQESECIKSVREYYNGFLMATGKA